MWYGVVVADADVEDGACKLLLRALQLLEVFFGSTIQQEIMMLHFFMKKVTSGLY